MIYFLTLQDAESNLEKRHQYLEESIQRRGGSLHCIVEYDKKIGNLCKILKLNDFLRFSTFEDDDVIVFCDAHDVIMHSGEISSLIDLFFSMNCHYIISSENHASHHLSEVSEWFRKKYNNCHINSGFQMGFVWAFKQIYGYICNHIHEFKQVRRSDQMVISQFFMKQKIENIFPKLILKLDTESLFCKTVNSATPLDLTCPSFFIHVTWLKNVSQASKFHQLRVFHGQTPVSTRRVVLSRRMLKK